MKKIKKHSVISLTITIVVLAIIALVLYGYSARNQSMSEENIPVTELITITRAYSENDAVHIEVKDSFGQQKTYTLAPWATFELSGKSLTLNDVKNFNDEKYATFESVGDAVAIDVKNNAAVIADYLSWTLKDRQNPGLFSVGMIDGSIVDINNLVYAD